MRTLRRIAWLGFGIGLLALATGLALTYGSAFAAGAWYQARQPWIGWGLSLLSLGLAMTAAVGFVLDLIEPVGWWRLVAIPPAIVLGLMWFFLLTVGLMTLGRGGPEREMGTILYSVDYLRHASLIGTALILLPLGVLGLRRRRA